MGNKVSLGCGKHHIMEKRLKEATRQRDRALLAMRRFVELEYERLSLCCMAEDFGLNPDEEARLRKVVRVHAVVVEAALKAMGEEE